MYYRSVDKGLPTCSIFLVRSDPRILLLSLFLWLFGLLFFFFSFFSSVCVVPTILDLLNAWIHIGLLLSVSVKDAFDLRFLFTFRMVVFNVFFFFIMIQISIFLSLVSLFIGSRPNLMLWIKLNMIKKRSFANSSVTPCIKSTKDNTELVYSKMDTTQ